jgi:hypothetical protein
MNNKELYWVCHAIASSGKHNFNPFPQVFNNRQPNLLVRPMKALDKPFPARADFMISIDSWQNQPLKKPCEFIDHRSSKQWVIYFSSAWRVRVTTAPHTDKYWYYNYREMWPVSANHYLACHQPPFGWITNDCLGTAFNVLHRRWRHEAKYGIYWIKPHHSQPHCSGQIFNNFERNILIAIDFPCKLVVFNRVT